MTTQSIAVEAPNPRIEIERVGGSAQIEGWERLQVEATGGDLEVIREGDAVRISAGGEALLKVPQVANLRIESVGGKLEIRDIQGNIDISLVGGDLVLLDLTGLVTLHGFVGGSRRLQNVGHIEEAPMGSGSFGAGPWPKVEKLRQRAEEKRHHVEKKILQAERKLERIRAGLGSDGRRWKWQSPSRTSQGSAEPGSAVSEEERAIILKMLQAKKITAEEADRLLQALEGEA